MDTFAPQHAANARRLSRDDLDAVVGTQLLRAIHATAPDAERQVARVEFGGLLEHSRGTHRLKGRQALGQRHAHDPLTGRQRVHDLDDGLLRLAGHAVPWPAR